jgi:DNA-binding NtrC family response regulator
MKLAGKILIVEDEALISRVCFKTLTAVGFEVDTAKNGMVAKDKIADEYYNIIILDIRTPAMNGMELYQYLSEERPELIDNVIFTTGDILCGNVGAFLGRVDRPFLPKPFTPDELVEIVRRTLERNTLVGVLKKDK